VSWLQRLKQGLKRSSSKLTEGISGIFTKRKLDDAAIEELEELLVSADLGVSTATKLTASLRRQRFGADVTGAEIRSLLAADIAAALAPCAKPLELNPANKPHVVLVVGVNGSGKTTTIGKLAQRFRSEGKSVMMAAGDTFRAAAVEQLQIWAQRTGAVAVTRPHGADAAGLAFDAVTEARAAGADLLLIDTAGRLQNKTDLMNELGKIVRVLRKQDPELPHACLLVLDATVGQNAHQQVEIFKSVAPLTGLVMTKLDGSAKGGVLVALAEKFALPIVAVGVGEGAEDLRGFDARDFADALMDVEGAR
jgi:fused signal recognition particle receptor